MVCWESRATGIDVDAYRGWVKLEHRRGFGPVDLETVSHYVFVCIVGTPLETGPVKNPLDQRFDIITGEVQDQLNLDVRLQEFTLFDVTRNAVEQQQFRLGIVGALLDSRL